VRRTNIILVGMMVLAAMLLVSQRSFCQLKIGYIDSQRILENYKEAIDAQKKLDAQNAEWQKQGKQMQQQLRDLQEQLDSQSLLLSADKKEEKQREIQELYLKFQQFQVEKWGQEGEYFKLNKKLMEPVIQKINTVIAKIGQEEKFDYIFDTIGGGIVYASPEQLDLTDRVLEELNKGVALETKSTGKKQ